MEGSLKEVIDIQLILIAPHISDFIYFLMKPMLSIFQYAIKFEYQFLAIFQVFFTVL